MNAEVNSPAGDINLGEAGRGNSAAAGREYFSFHGTGSEYFRIWIVNLLLTLVTLGIYSAWAKVRKNRYIYGNLELAGSYFEYLASPLIILRGRLIALFLLIVVLVSQSVFPPLYMASIPLLALIGPWLVVRSRMFNMRYTAYRNIRFAFSPAYGAAYKAIFLYGFLTVISFGLMAPYAHYQRNRLVVANTGYGNLKFRLGEAVGRFYAAYLSGFLAGVILLAPATAVLSRFSGTLADADGSGAVQPLVFMPLLLLVLFYFVIGKFVAAIILRITTNHTSLYDPGNTVQEHTLGCDWSLPGMLWINVTNLLAIALSVGLMIPWAQMRIMKYQLNHTWVKVSGNFDAVMAGQSQAVSSIGEEIGDVFDVDIGL